MRMRSGKLLKIRCYSLWVRDFPFHCFIFIWKKNRLEVYCSVFLLFSCSIDHFICYSCIVYIGDSLGHGVKKSPSPTPGASNFHIWASWNNQLYARRASKNIYRILTNLSIFAYLLIFIYVICGLISSNVLFIQPLAFCRNWEQRR